MNIAFSQWARWINRTGLAGLSYPGVYTLAISPTDISGTPFSWCPEIIYVGMTNSRGGLKSRLQQFDNTIKGGDGHGGGHRVRFKHSVYAKLTPRLYVSVCPYECDVTSTEPNELCITGDVVKCEYECFALFAERFGRLPEFNDKKRSPKK